jgi:hypothetical protein
MRSPIRFLAVIVLAAAAARSQEPASRPADVSTSLPLAELQVVEGRWAEPPSDRPTGWFAWRGSSAWSQVVFEGSTAEGFIRRSGPPQEPGPVTPLLVLRSAPGVDLSAIIVDDSEAAPTRVRVKIPKDLLGNATRQDWLTAARDRFRELRNAGVPGAAWFRHREAECDAELPKPTAGERRQQPFTVRGSIGRADEMSETYDFFSAGRAVSENLRLDRELTPIDGGEPTIEIGSIAGIATKAFDWKAAAAGLSPAKDPLASMIPEDQHAAFFPGVAALEAVLDAIDAHAPLLSAAESQSEELGVRAFYEAQLGLSTKDAGAAVFAKLVGSVAVTGSDPYFRTGTDVAVLFECTQPAALVALIAAKLAVGGKRVTEDRARSSYVAALDGAVVVTNSMAQLDKLVAHKGPTLADSPEYVFFRNRYPRTDAAETMFVILTDATIRRWCGPEWRIADARRTRAAARLADLTAKHARELVGGARDLAPSAPGLGTVKVGAAGFESEAYGNLRFLRPIAEMDVRKVTKDEAASYERFRQTYEQRWVNFFDPIAVRLELAPARMALDVTVMPVVAGSDYRELMSYVGNLKLGATACDPHDGAAVQLAIAIDAASAAMESWNRGARRLVPEPEDLAFAWLKGGVSVALDQDPVLDQLANAKGWQGFQELLPRIPILVTAEVRDPVMLAVFLTGLRASIEDAGVGSIRWTRKPHHEIETMTISGLEGVSSRSERVSVRYAIVDGLLLVALREDVLHRAIDRALDRREGKAAGAPWLGESAGLRVHRSFASFVEERTREDRERDARRRAFAALPILEEWRRLFPDKDPVAIHEKLYEVRLVDPAGGRYAVDAAKGLVFTEVYGHPTETRPAPKPALLDGFKEGRGGVTFENDGVRGRIVIEREK